MKGAAGDPPAPARTWRAALLPAAIAVVFAIYPVVVWLGLAKQSPRTVAIALLCVMLPVLVWLLRQSRGATAALLLAPVVTVAAIGAAAAFDDAAWLFVEPVAISAGLLLAFGSTLRRGGMPMVERFARMHEPDLSVPKQAWCRTWTWIWCAFFVVNGTTALVLAVAAPLSWWAWYNGSLVYVVMGTLFATEYVMRRRRFFRG
ncbi:MAG: hypothetical protein WAT39_18870 [Planctomycetota bacterium]